MKRIRKNAVALFIIIIVATALVTSGAAGVGAADHEIVCVTVQPGADEFSRGFTWLSTGTGRAGVQIVKVSDISGDKFPIKEHSVNGASAVLYGYNAYHVGVTGLEPNERYLFRVGSRQLWSDIYGFETGSTGAFSFLFAGDPQVYTSETVTAAWRNMVDNAVSRWPDAALLVSGGDQVDKAGSEDHHRRFFSPEKLKSIALAPTLGNHDSAANFTKHFNLPDSGGASGADGSDQGVIQGNYWYRYGNALFIHLNSCSVSMSQHRAFMRHAVDSNPGAKWRIVVMHHSIYSTAMYGPDDSRRSAFYPLMDAYNIDVVLSGHDHIYSRSHFMYGGAAQAGQGDGASGQAVNPKGTLYICGNSSSGSKYYQSTGVYPEFNAFQRQSETPNISHVEVTEDAFTIKTYCGENANADGELELIDAYTIIKR